MVRAIQTDVLVIGGGGAGFRAAIAAKQNGVKVLLASKGPLARCGATPMAGADFTLDGKSLKGFGFPGAADDSREKFFSDIVHQGFFLNNQRLLEQYVRSAPARLKELLAWGLKISRSEERAVYTSGLWIMDVLLRRAKAAGVEFLEDVMILDLVRKDRRVQGAVGLDVKTGEFIRISSRAVVIATGGWHKAFWPTTGMRDLSGEGIVMAHRAGAEIGNMEFVTFCCPVLLSPPHCRGSIATYIMILRAGGRLRNTAGEEFLNKYDPFTVQKGTFMEWNKLFLSLTTAKEVRAGLGSPNGGVFYDRGEMPWEEYEDRVTVSLTGWKYKAIDLSDIAARLREGDSIEVGAVAEYFDGGIIVDENFQTRVPGLYAAGECTLVCCRRVYPGAIWCQPRLFGHH
jgi:succinate dehydrogenase/fumarate reductase flavoprotein subunit